jgi:hypothetical protein
VRLLQRFKRAPGLGAQGVEIDLGGAHLRLRRRGWLRQRQQAKSASNGDKKKSNLHRQASWPAPPPKSPYTGTD